MRGKIKKEIATMELAIKYIRKGWGPCKFEDYVEGCAACEAGKVIEFLKKHIRYAKEE